MSLNENTMQNLSDLRKNIISWYPVKEESNILEIGAYYGDVTSYMCDIAKKVTAVTFSEDAKNKIQDKCKEKDNLEIRCLEDGKITLEEKYDYITLIGILEYSEKIFNILPEELLKKLKEYLKEDGTILIATENRLGINKLCTENKNTGAKYLGKTSIEKILENMQVKYKKYYYPLPNFIVPNVIFTDNYLPNSETIERNLNFYDTNCICSLDEQARFKDLIQEDKQEFKKLANSFFIEISFEEKKDNDIRFVSFSNIRNKQYRIKTVIQKNKVYKYNAEEESKAHIEQIKENIDILNNSKIKTVDSYEQNRIVSAFQEDVLTLDRVILHKCQEGKEEEALELINKFKLELENNLEKSENAQENVFDKYGVEYEKEDTENLNFVKYGLWDMVFKNCFYKENEFYFYDQEWKESNVPTEFILYRAVLYFPEISKYLKQNEIYQKLGITQKQIELFKKLDDILQEKIRDKKVWDAHLNLEGQNNLPKRIKDLENEKEKILEDCKELLLEKDGRINVLESGMEEAINTIKTKQEEIDKMVNSTSWKITEPLRKIKGNFNKK